eukprot:362471-Chlamydomonas_euryale.AAC.2
MPQDQSKQHATPCPFGPLAPMRQVPCLFGPLAHATGTKLHATAGGGTLENRSPPFSPPSALCTCSARGPPALSREEASADAASC